MKKDNQKAVASKSSKVKLYASNEDAALRLEQFGVPMAGRCTTTSTTCCCSSTQ